MISTKLITGSLLAALVAAWPIAAAANEIPRRNTFGGSAARLKIPAKAGIEARLLFTTPGEERTFWASGNAIVSSDNLWGERQIANPEPGTSVVQFEETILVERYWTLRTSSGNIYTSIDSGETWARRWDVAERGGIQDLRTTYGSPGSLVVSADGTVWISKDATSPWEPIFKRQTRLSRLEVERGGRLIVAADQDGVVIVATRESPDDDSFEIRTHQLGGHVNAIAIGPVEARKIYLALDNGLLMRSDDAGVSWYVVPCLGPSPLGERVHVLQAIENRIYAGTNTGLFVSEDEGYSWWRDLVLPDTEPVLSISVWRDSNGSHLSLGTKTAGLTASDRNSPCRYEPYRYILGRGPQGRDTYVDVGPKAASYSVALYNESSAISCQAMPYLPGSAYFVGNTAWVQSISSRYINTTSESNALKLPLGSYLFVITVTANMTAAPQIPAFRQRAFYLDKPRGSYQGKWIGWSQGVLHQTPTGPRTSTSCEMIPLNPYITPPTRNQSIISFTPRINCPNYGGRVTFIACGGPNQGITTRSAPATGGQSTLVNAAGFPSLGALGMGPILAAYDSDKTTCVVSLPVDY